ncbi:MAG: FliI/YscN family ATPase [Mariprofundaceae bacterium]|nr:FliI/YscN family ATPase [Mariprofundaceae bacterium]
MLEQAALWQANKRRKILSSLKHIRPFPQLGRVRKVIGTMIEVDGLHASIGRACDIQAVDEETIEAEVVGFRDTNTILMPVGRIRGIAPGNAVRLRPSMPGMNMGPELLGRILDGLGRPIDDMPLKPSGGFRPLHGERINPCHRHGVDTPLQLGVRAIDACLTVGNGQRIGLFSAAGVGKSSLMGMMAKNSNADVNVIALVGERSREVREFIHDNLGEDALQHSVVVVSTSDAAPVVRIRAVLLASTIAEYFRDQGRQVLMMMDSLTRFAQAQREIGLMLGEPPASKGYTPSCFAAMAEMLERAGPGSGPGNISGLYTVLVEGDDISGDPVADTAISILDGHIVLSRALAEQGHFPAIDLLRSVSRLSHRLCSVATLKAARSLRKELALYERMEDMVNMGAYERGSNPELDKVIQRMPSIRAFLQQQQDEHVSLDDATRLLIETMASQREEN